MLEGCNVVTRGATGKDSLMQRCLSQFTYSGLSEQSEDGEAFRDTNLVVIMVESESSISLSFVTTHEP